MCFSLMLCVEQSVSCSQGQVFQIGQSISTFAVHRAHAAAVPPLQLSLPAQGHSTKAESCCLSAPGCEAVAAAATKLNGVIGAASIGKRPGRERVLNATLVLFRPHLNQRHSRNRNILLAGVCDGEAGPVGSLCQHTVPGDCYVFASSLGWGRQINLNLVAAHGQQDAVGLGWPGSTDGVACRVVHAAEPIAAEVVGAQRVFGQARAGRRW